MEVALLNRTGVKIQLAIKGCRQTKDDAAFHLRTHNVWIHSSAAIDYAEHSMDFDRSILNRHLGHFGDIRQKGVMRREP